jgi:nucleoside phosphorylase
MSNVNRTPAQGPAPDPASRALKERFLAVFQGDVRNHILAFSKMLWERDSDVFIFMARKAACFFDCVRELGIADVRGVALSDRVLDMDLSFLRGKRITLVDDCVFTGTTLFNARNAATAAGCASFETVTLAVNAESIRPELLPGNAEWDDLRLQSPLFSMSDSDCIRQCYDIVRSISITPRPYDVDFPHSRTLKVKDQAFQEMLVLPGWQAVECTSDFQRAHDVSVFTLFPMRGVLAEFFARHGFSGDRPPDAKMRVYARRVDDSYAVRCVPIVMFPAVAYGDIKNALLAGCADGETSLNQCGLTSAHAQYRMLHYIIAHSLLHAFAERASEVVDISADDLRCDLAEMSFGEGFWAKYRKHWPTLTSVRIPPGLAAPHRSITTAFCSRPVAVDDDTAFLAEAIAPFTYLYKERELATRKLVKEKGLRAAVDSGFGHLNRLVEGFSPQVLFGRIQSAEIDVRSAMSSVLDRLVDSGIAVPTIVDDGSVCCRAFRHGEDAILGEAQERLLLQAMGAYLDARSTDGFWGLELQKLLVLTAQIGIRNGLLERLNLLPSIPSPVRVLSIKGHLHGPVPLIEQPQDPSGTLSPPYVAGNPRRPRWLVQDWRRQGFLSEKRTAGGTRYAITGMPTLSMGARSDAQARQIGRCLGAAVATGALDTDGNLVMLSTCSEPDHLLRALSGEIAIFRERWDALRQQLHIHAENKRFAEAHRLLRRHQDVFAAINSGAMKYRWYVHGDLTTLITSVAVKLKDRGNAAMADEWVQLWPQARPISIDKSSFVWKQIDDCGRWLVSLNVAMRVLDHWLVLEASRQPGDQEVDLAKSRSDLLEWARYAADLYAAGGSSTFSSLVHDVITRAEVADDTQARLWCEQAGRTLNTFARNNSQMLLEEISAICAAYGTVDEVVAYTYAVFVDVEERADRELLLHRVTEDALRACGVKKYRYLPENHNPWRTGLWILLTGNRKSNTAVAVCRQIALALTKKSVRYCAVIVGQLANDDCVRAYARSVALAHGFFFVRLSQLRTHLRPGEFNNTIVTCNEAADGFPSEGQKFIDAAGDDVAIQCSTAKCDSPDAPAKEFVVCKLEPKDTSPASKTKRLARSEGVAEMTVLLCTATDKEDDALAALALEMGFQNEARTIKRGTFRDLGVIGRSQVYWVRSDMGSSGPGGSFATTADAIASVGPTYVISCGLAFGTDSSKQELCDVLISQAVMCYEKGRQGATGFTPRGPRVPADPFLLQAARSARLDVRPIRCLTGLMLSGEKLIDDPAFKARLLALEPEAIGGEMEGSGILDACLRNTTRWIIVKGICDWAENKAGGAQPKAAENAMRVVFTMVQGDLIPVV